MTLETATYAALRTVRQSRIRFRLALRVLRAQIKNEPAIPAAIAFALGCTAGYIFIGRGRRW